MASRKITRLGGMLSVLITVTTYPSFGMMLMEQNRETTQNHYKVIDLGTLGGDSSSAYDVNDEGQIVGNSAATNPQHFDHAFLWHKKMQDLGVLDSKGGFARRINARGDCVGYLNYGNSFAPTRGFLYKDGKMTKLPALLGEQASEANGINDKGWIVGLSATKTMIPCAVIWHNGAIHKIDNDIGGKGFVAQAINNQDDIVGVADVHSGKGHAFFRHQGKMRDLGTLGGGDSYAWSLNDKGVSVSLFL